MRDVMLRALLLGACWAGIASCDDATDSVIPNARVDIELNTRTTGLPFEQNGYQLVTTKPTAASYIGYGGVLLVRGYTSTSEVYAFDLACPVECSPTVRLKVEDGYKAVCSKCGSEFDMIRYGNPAPTAGEAAEQKLLLRRYNAFYSEATYMLRAYN